MRWCGIVSLLLGLALLSACGSKEGGGGDGRDRSESREAKAMLQGIWMDEETEEVAFRAKGDTIFYPDSTSQPSYFRIVDDSLLLGSQAYRIEKQSPNVFWFHNQNGDVVKLVKSDDPDAQSNFVHDESPKILTYTEVVKKDSVVMFNGQRYHWYLAINPTKYKVSTTSYNDNGMEVRNVYNDNIMHISIFQGATQLFSRDFKKQMYTGKIPADFLQQSILSNMEFARVDDRGFHFDATVCIPDGASCYRVENVISLKGVLSTTLIEY